ncbi:MAG: orotidine-5'-phosphate decarboxylase [Firmicutes bacterium]|nr:orotidine-5'-phosphate decarboxylase [Erysipelotrichaceae bacterium]MDD6525662.1 orotidine-5'-phosphate decarboxylase [Bacillota bacterium]MDD7227206.1 orotidine-5'-phosphate decarboxylase [Bacillota bacterium]MDY4972245.1 orotidine-5'-phosphate decarboxylase [Erysipelotrichaceae bacterium]MDY5997589.1 orotidine-5'-phosphate decarboxylase [Erysipelotrichaceae bacterium]
MREVIIACDFSSKEATLAFLDQFKDVKPFVKIGMELYYAEGPSIVKEIKERGHKIFLDLKLHDIPNTVYKAMKNVAALGVDMTNVHAAGTIEMMKAAKKAIDEVNPNTKLIAVTQLTSTSEEMMQKELWIDHPINDTIQHYALNTQQAGLDGVVCSPLEAKLVKDVCNEDFITVTPGIRFDDASKGDQKRVTTPAMAREIGSSYIVVGRPITASDDPVAAYNRCVREFVGE